MSAIPASQVVTALAGGFVHSAALTSGGQLFAWGANFYGQLGDGTNNQSSVPVATTISGALAGETVAGIAAGYGHTVVRTVAGRVYAWGLNTYGMLGDGTTANRNTPGAVTMAGAFANQNVTRVVAGYSHNVALTSTGKLFAWGYNNEGELGNNTTVNSSTPVEVFMNGTLAGRSVLEIAAGGYHTIALAGAADTYPPDTTILTGPSGAVANAAATFTFTGSDDETPAAGLRFEVRLDNAATFTPVATDSATFAGLTDGLHTFRVRAIDAAGNADPTPAVRTWTVVPVQAFGWGYGPGVADGAGSSREVPTAALTTGALAGQKVIYLSGGQSHTLALTSDGKLFAWGLNFAGELGDGTTTDSFAPLAVNMTGALAGKTVIDAIAGRNFSVALTSDGQLFSWGRSLYGVLGDGTGTDRPLPGPVDMSALAGKTVIAIEGMESYLLALTADGKLFAWGQNRYGQLGDGTTTERVTPVPVDMSGALAGKSVTFMAAGFSHSLAVTSDGQLFGWGVNFNGELGDGTTTDRLTAVPLSTTGPLAGKRVVALAAGQDHSLAVTSDGLLFAWGYNGDGEVGDGTIINRTTPVQLTASGPLAGKRITDVAATYLTSLALTDDGQLYSWGLNQFGGARRWHLQRCAPRTGAGDHEPVRGPQRPRHRRGQLPLSRARIGVAHQHLDHERLRAERERPRHRRQVRQPRWRRVRQPPRIRLRHRPAQSQLRAGAGTLVQRRAAHDDLHRSRRRHRCAGRHRRILHPRHMARSASDQAHPFRGQHDSRDRGGRADQSRRQAVRSRDRDRGHRHYRKKETLGLGQLKHRPLAEGWRVARCRHARGDLCRVCHRHC